MSIKYTVLLIPSGRHMVKALGKIHPWFSRHERLIAQQGQGINTCECITPEEIATLKQFMRQANNILESGSQAQEIV